jgi:LysR family transcriptional regulator for bpeEF and oprC
LYLERFGTPIHPRELERHRCVNYFSSKTGKIYPWDFSKDGERIELPLPGWVAMNDTNSYMQAGLAGLGVIMTADFMLRPYLDDGRLVPIMTDWVTDAIPIHVVYPQNRHLSAKVRVFVEWVADLFASHHAMRLRPLAAPQPVSLEAIV